MKQNTKGTMKKNITNKHMGAISLVLLSALSFSEQADIVIFSGFDHSFDNPVSGSPLSWGGGAVANFTAAYVDGAGAGGSQAVVITTDFTGEGGTVGYNYLTTDVSGNTSANIGDYTLSFDAAVNVANAGFQLALFQQGPEQMLQSPSDFLISTPNTFEHFSLNLGSAFVETGPYAQNFDPRGTVWGATFFTGDWLFGDPSTGDQLIISNLELTMVPEPSSLALCTLGAMAGLTFLRRRTLAPPTFWPNCTATAPQRRFPCSCAPSKRERSGCALSN